MLNLTSFYLPLYHRLLWLLIVILLGHVVSEVVGVVLKEWDVMQAVGVEVIRL